MELKEESQTHRLKAVWTIPKFSELEHEFDVCSQSLPVRVGPHPFRIDLLAGGTPPGEDKQAGVAVRVKNESKRRIDVKLSVTLRGKKVIKETSEKQSLPAEWVWTAYDIVPRQDVLKAIVNDTLRIDLDIKVTLAGGPAPSLGVLLARSDASDCSISVGGQVFQVHKCVLSARSPVFAAMLRNGMSESKSGKIVIEDAEPCVVREMLQFMYTSDCLRSRAGFSLSCHADEAKEGKEAKEDADDADDAMSLDELTAALLQLADKYQVPDLVQLCVDVLNETMTTANLCERLALAAGCNNDNLKEACLKHVAEDVKRIAQLPKTAGFKSLSQELIAELMATAAPDWGKKRKAKGAPEGEKAAKRAKT